MRAPPFSSPRGAAERRPPETAPPPRALRSGPAGAGPSISGLATEVEARAPPGRRRGLTWRPTTASEGRAPRARGSPPRGAAERRPPKQRGQEQTVNGGGVSQAPN